MIEATYADSVKDTVASLRESWSWLGELTEPGWETTSTPIISDEQRARIDRAIREERDERHTAKARGLGPLTERVNGVGVGALAPARAGARLAIVDASITVRQLTLEAARHAAAAKNAVHIGFLTGDAGVLEALAFLDGGQPCWIAGTTGVIGRRIQVGILDTLELVSLMKVERLLHRADRIARSAAGVTGDETVTFPHPCPACGSRSLQWRMPGRFKTRWSVHCIRDACRCTGNHCGCAKAIRVVSQPHRWAYSELDGRFGLWRAIAAARRVAPPIRSGAAGHGGWPERQ
jgi:hypothetical protein